MIQLMHINGILILIPKCHVTDETIRMHASINSHIGRLSSLRLLYYRLSDSVNSRREFILEHDNQNHYLLFAVASSHEFNVIGSNTLSRLLYLIVLELQSNAGLWYVVCGMVCELKGITLANNSSNCGQN